jgi:membrane-associated phospholipid phosphatase
VTLLARIFSIVFHPLLLATYLFALLAFSLPLALDPLKEEGYLNFIFLIFCVTFLFPALNVGIFKTFGSIKSLTMRERHERVLPFFFIAILYIVVTYMFYSRTRIDMQDNLLKILIIIDSLVLLSAIATLFLKVSVHSLGMCGMIGILLPLNKISEDGALFYPTIATVVLTGVVMSSRLQLNVHTPKEVTVGAVLGFSTSYLLMHAMFSIQGIAA